MTKLTKKQTRKLTSRKTKKLLKGGGPLGRLGSKLGGVFRGKQKKITKTVPPESPSTPSTYVEKKTNPIPGQALPPRGRNRQYSPANANAMNRMSKAHYEAIAELRGFTNSSGNVRRVTNPLYITSESANGSANGSASGYSSLAPRQPAAATPSLETTSGYSVLSPQGEPKYVRVSNLSRNQTLYASTPSPPGQEVESLKDLTKPQSAQGSKFKRQQAVRKNPILNKINRYKKLAKSRNTLSTKNRNKLIGLQMEIEKMRLRAATPANEINEFLKTKREIRGRLNSYNTEMFEKAQAELQKQQFEQAGRNNLEETYGPVPVIKKSINKNFLM